MAVKCEWSKPKYNVGMKNFGRSCKDAQARDEWRL